MAGVIRSKQQQEQDDLKLAKKLKPKLPKFLIDEQTKTAAAAVQQNEERVKQVAAMESFFKDVVEQARTLSRLAWIEQRLWQVYPHVFETQWIRAVGTSPELERGQAESPFGFEMYLVNEYLRTYLPQKDTAKKGYRNPLARRNLTFFWQKWNQDLSLLIVAEARRVKAGNESSIIAKGARKGCARPIRAQADP